MANKTISDLNELTTVSNSDVLLVETNTETSKVTKENLLKEVNEQLINKSNVSHTHDEYVTDSELEAKGLATETFVTNKIAEAQLGGEEVDLSGLATKAELATKADKTAIPTKTSQLTNDSGFLTEHQNISSKADKTYVDNQLATKADKTHNHDTVYAPITHEHKQYLTSHQDLSDYALKTDIPTKTSQLTNDSGFITSIPSEYITETELETKGYLTEHQSLTDYAKKTDIPDVSDFLTEVPSEYVTDTKLSTELDKKVNKEVGKRLSTNDLTNELVEKINSSATETFVTNKIAEAQLGGTEGGVDLSGYATKDELNSKVSYDDFNVVTGAIWFKGADGNFSGMAHKYLVYKFEKSEFALNDGDIAVFKMKIRCKNPQDLSIIKGLRLWHNKAGSPNYSASYTQINQQTREYTIQVTINSSQETYYQCDLAMVFSEDYYEDIEGYVFDVTVENKTTSKILYNVAATNEETPTLKHNQEFTMIELSGYATETFVTNKIAEAQLGGTGGSADLSRYVTYDDFNVVTGATWFKGADGNWAGIWHKYLVYKFEKSEFALNDGDNAVFKMKIRCKNPQDLNMIEGLRLWHNKAGGPDFSKSYTQINQQTREYTIQVTIKSSQETYYQCDLAMVIIGDHHEDIEGYVFDVTVENKTTGRILYNVIPTTEETPTLKLNQGFTMIGARMDDIKIKSHDLEESYIPSVKNKKIICAGDSLTAGYNGANSSYVQHVQNFYPDCTVLNKGSNGGGTDRLVNMLTNMARDDASTFPIDNPDYSDCVAVIINIGTNGGVSGNKNTSIPQLVEKTVADIPFQYNDQTIDSVEKYWSLFSNDWWGNMGLIIEYIKWKNPKTQIFLTPPAVNRISDTETSSPFKIREAMFELGDIYGLTVIDVIQGLGINKRNNHLFRVDYCHGNDLRNEMVGKYIAKQIYSHIYDF